MLEPAIARAKRDQPGIFGISERDPRLRDALEPGGRRVALEDGGSVNDSEISPTREEGGFALARAQHERRGEQRGELCQSDRGEGTAPGRARFGAETGRFG